MRQSIYTHIRLLCKVLRSDFDDTISHSCNPQPQLHNCTSHAQHHSPSRTFGMGSNKLGLHLEHVGGAEPSTPSAVEFHNRMPNNAFLAHQVWVQRLSGWHSFEVSAEAPFWPTVYKYSL